VIVVAGGTGRLGQALVPRLLDSGREVRVFARGLSGVVADGAEIVLGDIRNDGDVARAVAGADVVVSAVQGFAGPGRVTPRSVDREGNRSLVAAAARAGAEVVLMSVTQAAPDSPLQIAREKYAAEQALHESGAACTVVRAAAFAELWIQILEDTAARSRRPLVFGRGETPLWWVSTDDVADVLARVVLDPSQRGRTLDVVGPEGLGLHDLAVRVMTARGWPGAPRRIPSTVLRLGSVTVGAVVPPVGRQLRAALAMAQLSPETAAAQAAGAGRRSVDDLLGVDTSPSRSELTP
jgi:NADH dehydrogenase